MAPKRCASGFDAGTRIIGAHAQTRHAPQHLQDRPPTSMARWGAKLLWMSTSRHALSGFAQEMEKPTSRTRRFMIVSNAVTVVGRWRCKFYRLPMASAKVAPCR